MGKIPPTSTSDAHLPSCPSELMGRWVRSHLGNYPLVLSPALIPPIWVGGYVPFVPLTHHQQSRATSPRQLPGLTVYSHRPSYPSTHLPPYPYIHHQEFHCGS